MFCFETVGEQELLTFIPCVTKIPTTTINKQEIYKLLPLNSYSFLGSQY